MVNPARLGTHQLPASCRIALKEWAGVCAALVEGRQSILLRKGGLEDDPGETWTRHETFWLFPTRFHEPSHGLRPGVSIRPSDPAPAGFVDLSALATVESISVVTDEADLASFKPLHLLAPETVGQRFHYRRPGVVILSVRVYAGRSRRIMDRPEYAGCKSWVDLDQALSCEGLTFVSTSTSG